VAKAQVAARREPNAVVRFVRETIAELRKVNWPTRREATNLTVIVLISLLVMSLLLGFLDYLFQQVFKLLVGLF